MNIEPKAFQDEIIQELVDECRYARDEVTRGGRPQAVVLVAPTGSGKTFMATSLMETLLAGDEAAQGDDQGTFLWITDQPELNEQTRRKILEDSSVFTPDRVVTVDASFDQDVLSPGCIYFLNIQKLREGALLVTEGDERDRTFWQTVTRTVHERGSSFWVILDEAHKGMAQTSADRERAQSIVQKFIKGSDELQPVPLLLGLSATPQRFLELLAESNRNRREVSVAVEAVRASGLLKETIFLFHPAEAQPADITLLKSAAERLLDYEHRWSTYHERGSSEEQVSPILVIQVEDASRGRITRTDVGEALRRIEAALGPLEGDQVAHSFQEGTQLEIDDRVLRYLAPADIQKDPDVRVVFFKMSLNTGWDCPRAEVMMSFRSASDYTYIAQLVGRMVRTPLARRIDSDEFLNTVSLYLPHYDETGLNRVLDYLQNPDPGVLPATTVERGEDIVSLSRNPNLAECFTALAEIPTYSVPTVRKMSNARRLMKLARLLANDELLPTALDEARSLLVSTLKTEREERQSSEVFRNVVRDSGVLDIRQLEYEYGLGDSTESRTQIPVTQENVNDLFEAAGRKLGDGLHKDYWRARAEQEPATTRRLGKLELFALVHTAEVTNKLESVAGERIAEWQEEYRHQTTRLPPDRQDDYEQIRGSARLPEAGYMARMPETITAKLADTEWEGHLYISDWGKFPYMFRSSWEPLVLREEQERGIVGFLRNEDRKPYSLTIPYEKDNRTRPLFPDFLVFRQERGGIAVDILDPHSPTLDDWPEKAVGLAKYADRHGRKFGRIQLIVVENGATKRLDLTKDDIRRRVLAVRSAAHLRDIFATED